MQIKTIMRKKKAIMRDQSTPPRIAIIKRKQNKIISISENVDKVKASYVAGENVKWDSHYGKPFDNSSTS